jgi:hypothetical protein
MTGRDVLLRAGAMSAYGPKRTSPVAPHMSAFGGKADIFVLSAISLRQCRSMRRRIAKPDLRGCPGIGALARLDFHQPYLDIVRADVLDDFVTRRVDALALVRHNAEFSRAGLQANSWGLVLGTGKISTQCSTQTSTQRDKTRRDEG